MKRLRIFLNLIVCFCILICLCLTSCCGVNDPPKFSSVQNDFVYHKDDIQLVLDYLLNCDYENIYIMEEKGKVYADFQEYEIDESAVKEAVKRLVESGDFVDISKQGGTVIFEMWNGMLDIGCGAAYSIEKNTLPEIQFQTELIPLSEAGWYYYVYDYNKWRTEEKNLDVIRGYYLGNYALLHSIIDSN